MKYFLAVAALVASFSVHAAGPNDGLYQIEASNSEVIDYGIIMQNGDTVIAVILDGDSFTWEASQGVRVGDSVSMAVAVPAGFSVPIELVFEDLGRAVMTFGECSVPCNVGPSVTWTFTKIF